MTRCSTRSETPLPGRAGWSRPAAASTFSPSAGRPTSLAGGVGSGLGGARDGGCRHDPSSSGELNLGVGCVVQGKLELGDSDRHDGWAERDLTDVQWPVVLLQDVTGM